MKSFFEEYVLLNLKDYFGDGWDMQPMLWLLCLSVGLCAACFAVHFVRGAMYVAVKQAVRHRADDVSRAKTVGELGLASRRLVCRLLRRGDGQIYRALTIADAEQISYEDYVAREKERRKNKEKRAVGTDLSTARFYISERTRPFADRILAAGDEPIFHPILASVAVLLLYVLVAALFPSLAALLASL